MLYVREGVSDLLRARAYDILLNLGALRHAPLVKLIFYTLRTDPSPFIRRRLVRAIGMGLGSMPTEDALGDQLWRLLTSCWAYEPSDRPTAAGIRDSVSSVLSLLAGALLNYNAISAENHCCQ